jgi:hypothetical protein
LIAEKLGWGEMSIEAQNLISKLLPLDKEDVKAIRSFLPGKLVGRLAALLALVGLVLSQFPEIKQGIPNGVTCWGSPQGYPPPNRCGFPDRWASQAPTPVGKSGGFISYRWPQGSPCRDRVARWQPRESAAVGMAPVDPVPEPSRHA